MSSLRPPPAEPGAAIEGRVERAIAAGDLELALESVQRAVEQIIYRPAFTARLFSSPVLDRLCQSIGSAAAAGRSSRSTTWTDATVFLATHVYATGGHSAVLEDFVRQAGSGPRHVVLTGAVRMWDRSVAQARFARLGCRLWFAPRGALKTKLGWLMDWLAECAPARLFLFHHHQDAVAVAAAQPQSAKQTVFYHHADHQLCLGVHLRHAVHVDPHPMGFYNCRTRLGLAANVYCPITVPDLGPRPVDRGFPANGESLLTCTVGNRNKIEREYPHAYWEIVPEFLRLTGGRHLHIGNLSASAVARLRRGLRARGLSAEHFEHVHSVPNAWSEFVARGVDAYLCSFPYGGVRAGIEAMGAGLPVIVHEHRYSRFLGAADATYPGAFRWRTPQDLWEIARHLDSDTLGAHARRARTHYEAFHREELLRRFLARPDLAGQFQEPPEQADTVDAPQAGLDPPTPSVGDVLKPILLRAGRSVARTLWR